MYSLVLMAAVSGSPDVSGADAPAMAVAAPVSYGCSGVVVGGYGCSAVSSYACYGSCYGRGHGCGMSVAMPAYRYGCGAVAPTYGCSGSACYGSSCHGTTVSYGCSGSCHGAAAPAKAGFLGIRDRMRARREGTAGMGCAGSSCYGSVSYGCMGTACYGSSCYGASCHGVVVSYGCSGGCYGTAVWGAPVHTGVIMTETKPAEPKPMDTKPADPKAADPKKTGGNEEGANIKFTLPANAKLFVDGRQTSGEGTERAFFTPPLAAGQKFFYDVKAEVVVDGKTVTEEKRVIVRAGDDLREAFPKLIAAAGSNPANVASK